MLDILAVWFYVQFGFGTFVYFGMEDPEHKIETFWTKVFIAVFWPIFLATAIFKATDALIQMGEKQ